MTIARLVRAGALILAVFAVVWVSRLWLLGGFDVVVAGHLVRSHDPLRPVEVLAGAVVLYVLCGGWTVVASAFRSARTVWPRVSDPIGWRIAMAIALSVFALTLTCSATTAAGADSSGYISEADRWLRGPLMPSQPWAGEVPWPDGPRTFQPLGYGAIESRPPFRQAPTYSPGLPLLLAAAKAAGGQAAMAVVVPLSCAVLVLASYGIGRRLRGPLAGAIAAWFAATSPVVLMMSTATMSDVPAGAAWATAFYFLIGDTAWSALAAGLASAVAITIRPNVFFLAGIMGVWFFVRKRRGGASQDWGWRARLRDAVFFSLGVLPGPIFIAWLFKHLYGSPFSSGYGAVADLVDLENIWPNLQLYFHWGIESQPVVIPAALVGLVLLPMVFRAGNSRRAMVIGVAMVLATLAEYAVYGVFDAWWYLRFFLVIWAVLVVLAAALTAAAIERVPSWIGTAALAGVVLVGGFGLRTAADRSAFSSWEGERHYVAAAMLLDEVSPSNSVVFSFQESGALRYYSGRVPIRYDFFDGDWLDRSVEWLAARGVQTYAVLDAFEVPRMRARFAGQERAHVLDTPIVIYYCYRTAAQVFIFNLTSPPAPGASPRRVFESDPRRWRNWPPGPEPALVLRDSGK
jgi:hypothetical protein